MKYELPVFCSRLFALQISLPLCYATCKIRHSLCSSSFYCISYCFSDGKNVSSLPYVSERICKLLKKEKNFLDPVISAGLSFRSIKDSLRQIKIEWIFDLMQLF